MTGAQHRDTNGTHDRGQTSIDFAISMGILLVALVTAVAFLPLITGSFVGFSGENTLVADRAVDQLVDYQLADQRGSATLNATCTVYFFSGNSSDPCPSFESDEPVTDRLGLGDRINVNVTVEQNVAGSVEPEVLCAAPDPDDGDVVGTVPCSGSEVRLATGPTPPDTESVTEARRMAKLDGRQNVFVRVHVWK